MIEGLKAAYAQKKTQILETYREKIRERAISQAKVRIALAGKKVGDFDEDELEIIVKEEEDRIRANIMKTIGLGLLVALGIS